MGAEPWQVLDTEDGPPPMGIFSRKAVDESVRRQNHEKHYFAGREPKGVRKGVGGHGHARALTDGEKRGIAERYRRGVSIKKLAKRYHRSHSTITETLRDMGCVVRNNHERKDR